MKSYKSIMAVLAISVLLATSFGCQEGPAERAGKKIDKTVEKGGQEVEKAGKQIQENVQGK